MIDAVFETKDGLRAIIQVNQRWGPRIYRAVWKKMLSVRDDDYIDRPEHRVYEYRGARNEEGLRIYEEV